MKTIKAYECQTGTKIKHENGLNYEIEVLTENKNGKIKMLLKPYQNSMSASKRITVKEDYQFILV